MNDRHDDDSTLADIDAARDRAIAAVERCLLRLVTQAAGDHRRCGKAACARSRRCRGFACEPDLGDGGAHAQTAASLPTR